MPDKQFDPAKFIDREFEQDLFEDILLCKAGDTARILAIRDKGGMGKTHLLEKFENRCRVANPQIPVALIALDQLSPQAPFALVERVEKLLRERFKVPFPKFKQYNTARVLGDLAVIKARADFAGATFAGATNVRIGTVMQNFESNAPVTNYVTTGTATLSLEQEKLAQDVCIDAFFEDIKKQCDEKTVVLLFDTYERCGDELRDWIEKNYLLARHFFDMEERPARLVLVVAGRSIPKFELNWPAEHVEAVVESVNQLGKWERRHVEECLRKHGFGDLAPGTVDTFYNLIQMGFTPSDVVSLIETHNRGSVS